MLREKYQTLVSFPRMRVIEGAPRKENKKKLKEKDVLIRSCQIVKVDFFKNNYSVVNRTALLLLQKRRNIVPATQQM